MPKSTTVYTCNACDAQFQKWSGKCLECGKWGTIDKEAKVPTPPSAKNISSATASKMMTLTDAVAHDIIRTPTHISEVDRVLGGGIVPGSLILLTGEPGIGKSTLTLHIAAAVHQTYIFSGEESEHQIALRAKRLMDEKNRQTISLSHESCVDSIVASIEKEKPTLAIVDSIQTMFSTAVENEPGSITQIRACTTLLLSIAKKTGTAIIIIGHVTKDGNVAGPKMLEHLVDVVVSFEGDSHQGIRLLRTTKNRFGSADEVGLFTMTETGLTPVKNPSELLLADKGEPTSGSVITCLLEGNRPMLVEIQALVTKTSFGYPVRKASGFDVNRLHLLVAVLQKRTTINLTQYDVHINVVGGVDADEPAADLAVCFAIASSYNDKPVANDLCVFGEVGLSGDIRSVTHIERRLKECSERGMKRIITKTNITGNDKKLQIVSVKNIQDLTQQTK